MDLVYVAGVWRSSESPGDSCSSARRWADAMGAFELLGAALSVGLFVYLLVALLAPEKLS